SPGHGLSASSRKPESRAVITSVPAFAPRLAHKPSEQGAGALVGHAFGREPEVDVILRPFAHRVGAITFGLVLAVDHGRDDELPAIHRLPAAVRGAPFAEHEGFLARLAGLREQRQEMPAGLDAVENALLVILAGLEQVAIEPDLVLGDAERTQIRDQRLG